MKDVESKEIYEMSGERSLDILETMLNNRHIAPTCPDTLGCYPFSDHDPFVLEASPHIFVAGNQMEFATRLVKAPVQATQDTDDSMGIEEADARNVRLISVPRFDRTGQVVFVNLRSLDCTVREFATSI